MRSITFSGSFILASVLVFAVFPWCADGKKDPGSMSAGAESAASHDEPVLQASALPVPLTILSMQLGDIACYVEFKDANGQQHTMKAEHDLCNDLLVGKQVVFHTAMARVAAPACEGDPECELSVEEEIIVGIDRI